MAKLSSKHQSFIELMKTSDELARRGFELLVAAPNFTDFFVPLQEAGLFSPDKNPVPVPAGDPGFYRVPYWSALDYLEAVAKYAGESEDRDLGERLMEVVRSVSRAPECQQDGFGNYHTAGKFANILGLIPTTVIRDDDLELIPIWLSSRFESGSVARSLSGGVIKRLLQSEDPADWNKATEIVRHCTALRWLAESGPDRKRPYTVVKDYWLKKLLDQHVPALAQKVGRSAAELFSERLREISAGSGRGSLTWLWRPAVEDHPQNHKWHGAENLLVEGLRETLLHWVTHDRSDAVPYIDAMLKDEAQIVRRVALYVVDQRWDILRSIFEPFIDAELFESSMLHELYCLLERRFSSFREPEKAATLRAIHHLSVEGADADEQQRIRYTQRNWLSAIVGKGSAEADAWYEELDADPTLGSLSDHPSFHSYMSSWRGPGPSPYQPQELLALAAAGALVDTLNSFVETDSWRGPTTRALVDSLESTAIANPQVLLSLVPEFGKAKRPYQYGLLNAFRQIWESSPEAAYADWLKAWSVVLSFMEELLLSESFWEEPAVDEGFLTPTRDWIPPLAADLLRAGTRDDSKAYPPELLERGWKLIEQLLKRSEALSHASDDPMTDAINSPKGKAVEALYSHALRVCRLSDREVGDHAESWERMSAVFDRELSACTDRNYEFSTLSGAYLGNLDYLSRTWLRANVCKIFSADFLENFTCAIDGLAYAQFGRDVYLLLLEQGVFDRALRLDLKGRNARQKLIERLAIMYLWGDESLSSPRFEYLFAERCIDDLVDVAHFFKGDSDGMDDSARKRVLDFWHHCVEWARSVPEAPPLLSALSGLTSYLSSVGPHVELLTSVAPHVAVNHNDTEFIEELLRLVEASPEEVNAALGTMLDHHTPVYDFRGALKELLRKLASKGYRSSVMNYAEKLRGLEGMLELFDELNAI